MANNIVAVAKPVVDFKAKIVEGDGKFLSRLVKDTIRDYTNSNNRLHLAAVAVVYHALRYGNTTPMNDFYTALEAQRKNDANSFRVWVGVAVLTPDATAEKPVRALTYKKDEGFRINKAIPAAAREAMADFDAFMNMQPFFRYDIRENEVKKAVALADILKVLSTAISKAEKLEEENGITVPKVLKAEMHALETLIKRTSAAVVLSTAEPDAPMGQAEAA